MAQAVLRVPGAAHLFAPAPETTRKADMEKLPPNGAEIFVHVRVIIGMILGLSLARMINGLTRFIQHPTAYKTDLVHMTWTVYVLVSIPHFWWFEFNLRHIEHWNFGIYAYLLTYAALFAAISALLFPDQINEYKGYSDYFVSRRRWFYGLLILLKLADIGDTLLKGTEYYASLGDAYDAQQMVLIIAALAGCFIRSRLYHMVFAAFAIFDLLGWIAGTYFLPT